MLHVVTHNYMYLHKIHVVSQELYTCKCRYAKKLLVITQKLHVLQKKMQLLNIISGITWNKIYITCKLHRY